MSANIAHDLQGNVNERVAPLALRARLVLALGPATALGGVVWAVAQPWRLTLLHPHGQGFWWLLIEPPLFVVLVGLLFRVLLAPGIVEDMSAQAEAPAPPLEAVAVGREQVRGVDLRRVGVRARPGVPRMSRNTPGVSRKDEP